MVATDLTDQTYNGQTVDVIILQGIKLVKLIEHEIPAEIRKSEFMKRKFTAEMFNVSKVTSGILSSYHGEKFEPATPTLSIYYSESYTQYMHK